ncbi:MAG: hypothetical protein JST54_08470 [Deltaproteobacteria bacterium]|nr:hypothetical protein [Deltaproteobacteria bacterium]
MAEQEPIFTPEPPPAVPPKRKMSSGVKIALGCGLLMLLTFGGCGVAVFWCGHAMTTAGDTQWTDLSKLANDLDTDAGAQAEYNSHPGLAEAYPTAQDFVGAVRLWRPNLEHLPEQKPPMLSGKVNTSMQYNNGTSVVVLSVNLASGKRLVAQWKNKQLTDLTLE